MLKNLLKDTYDGDFVRLGVIRKGTEKIMGKTGLEMGKDLGDKLRFEPDVKDPFRRSLLLGLFESKFGSITPTEIRCELSGDTVEQVLYSFYTEFNSSKQKLTECDGERILKKFNPKTQKLASVDRPCKKTEDWEVRCPDCQATTKLHVFMPELSDLVELEDGSGYRFYGGIDIITASASDGAHLAKRLMGFESMANRMGETLHGLPVRIYRVEEVRAGTDRKKTIRKKGQVIDNPNFMKPMRQKKWYLEIELDAQRWAEKLYKRGVDSPFLITASTLPAIASAPQESLIAPAKIQTEVRDDFRKMLASHGVDLQFNGNGTFISVELYKMGFKKFPDNGMGDANQIPRDKLEDVVDRIIELLTTHNNLNLQPVKSAAFDPSETDRYLDAIATEVE